MPQLLLFLAILVGVSFAIGKLLSRKEENDQAVLTKGCSVLLGLVLLTSVGLFIFSAYQKRNPNVSEKQIKNDIVDMRRSPVSTLSQIQNLKVLEVIRNDDLLEVQISADFDSKPYKGVKRFALKYEYSFFNDLGWDLDKIVPLNNK